MENFDEFQDEQIRQLQALAAMTEDQVAHRVRAQRLATIEASKPQFKNPRFISSGNPRIPFLLKGTEADAYGYRIEQMIEVRFADLIRKKIALSDDVYLDMMFAAMRVKTSDEFKILENKILDYHGFAWSDEVAENFKRDCAYFAGYFDLSTRLYVEAAVGYGHPVLGSASSHSDFTSEELLAIADGWNRQFLAQEKALREHEAEVEKGRIATQEMLSKERADIINRGINHHSNKVRRRTKKKYDL